MNQKGRKIVISKWLENPDRSEALIAKELKMPRRSVNLILRNYFSTFSVDIKPGRGRPAGAKDPTLDKKNC
jgi:hypothetical protein